MPDLFRKPGGSRWYLGGCSLGMQICMNGRYVNAHFTGYTCGGACSTSSAFCGASVRVAGFKATAVALGVNGHMLACAGSAACGVAASEGVKANQFGGAQKGRLPQNHGSCPVRIAKRGLPPAKYQNAQPQVCSPLTRL